MLDAHNPIRARVGVPPLVWSDQLARVAQDWANHLIATSGFSHRPNNRYGVNIFTISGGHATPAQVVNNWARDSRGYDVRSNTCRTLAIMHGSSLAGDGASALRTLADDYDRRVGLALAR